MIDALKERFDKLPLDEQKELWQGFLKHECWAQLDATLEGQAQLRTAEVLAPLDSNDGVLANEFMKGEISALNLIRGLPRLALANVEMDIQSSKESQK